MQVKVGLGQDSHRFDLENKERKLMLAGVCFEGETPLKGNSDADVVLHALTNAVSSITGRNIIGDVSDEMCKAGITDSRVYLEESLKFLIDYRITHISISIECQSPKITPKIPEMKETLAKIFSLSLADIGITATSGEGLTAFGRNEGIQALTVITAVKSN